LLFHVVFIVIYLRIFDSSFLAKRVRRPSGVAGGKWGHVNPRLSMSADYYNFDEFIFIAKFGLLLSKKKQNNYSKYSAFVSSALFAPIFHYKLCSFCSRGRKNISCPRALGTLGYASAKAVRDNGV